MVNIAQTYLAWIIVSVALLSIAIVVSRLKYLGMEKIQKQHLMALNKSEYKSTSEILQLTSDLDREEIREELRQLVNSNKSESILTSINNIYSSVTLKISELTKLPHKLVSEGILFIVVGGIAMTNIDVISHYTTNPTRFDKEWLFEAINRLYDLTIGFSMEADAFVFVYAQSIKYLVEFYKYIYDNPYVTGAILIYLAILIYGFIKNKDYEVRDNYNIKPNTGKLVKATLVYTVLVWTDLVLVQTVFASIGQTGIGFLGALILFGVLSLVYIGYALKLLYQSYKDFSKYIAAVNNLEDVSVNPLVYGLSYALNTVSKIFAIVISPVLFVYAFEIVRDGKAVELLDILRNSELHVQLLLAGFALIMTLIIIKSILDVYSEIREDLSKVLQYYSLKIKIAKKVVPYLTIPAFLLGFIQLGLPLIPSVALSVVGAVLIRVLVEIYFRVRLQAAAYEREINPHLVTVHYYEVEDANPDREPYPILNVNKDIKLMGDAGDHEEVITDGAKVIDSYFDNGNYPMTISEYRYDRSFNHGLTWTDKEKEMSNEVREVIIQTLVENGYDMPKRKLDKLKESNDPEIYDSVLRQMHHEGTIRIRSGRVHLRDNYIDKNGVVDKVVRAILG